MSDTPLGRMIIEMGLDDTNFAKGVTGVNKQLTALKNDLKTSQTSVSAFGKGVDGVVKPTEVLNKLIQTQTKQLQQLQQSYSGSLVDGKATASTQNYANQISRANANLAQYATQLKGAMVEQYKQQSILPKISDGLSKASEGFGTLAGKVAPASLAVTGVFAKGVQAATNFNSEMTTMRSLLSDGTPAATLNKNMDEMASKSKEWAKTYGLSTTEVNTGLEDMVKKGYDFNQTMGAMPSVLNASKASGEDFSEVMSNSTSILEEFNLKTDDTQGMMKNTQRVTDSLSFVANKTASSFSDIGLAMEYVGPVANGLNMSVESTASIIGILSNNGIEAEKAGTGLRSVLSSLLKPSKKAAGAMKDLGINTEGFKKGTVKLPDVIDEITNSTKGMTKAQRSALLAQAFGTQGQTTMNVLVAQGAEKLKNLSQETDKATGYTKKLADQMNNSDKNAFAKAKASLEVLAIDLGQKLLPKILPIVQKVDDLAGAFDKLDPKTQQTIVNLGLMTAAAYPGLKALDKMSGSASNLMGILAKLGEKGAAKLAVKGIATEALGASTALGGMAEGAAGAAGAVGGAGGLTAEIGGLAPILAGLGPVAVGALGVAGITGLILGVSKVVDDAKERMKYFGTVEVPPETVKKVETFKGKIDDLSVAAETFETKGKNAFDNVSKAIKGLSSTADSDIDSATKKLQDEAKKLGFSDDVINHIKNGGNAAKGVVKQATEDITNIYKKANDEHRSLTLTEQAQAVTDQQKIAQQEIDALGVTGAKKKQLMEALTGDINNISQKQAQEYSSSIQSILDKSDETFYQKKNQLDDLLSKGGITQEQYTAKEKELQNEHDATTQAYLGTLENMIMKQGEGLVEGTDQYKSWYTTSSEILEKYGVNLIDLVGKNGKAIDAITASGDSLKAWNSIPDPVKKLLGDNSNFKNNEAEASQVLTAWNKAPADAKQLLAEDLTKNPTMSAQAMINTLIGKSVLLGATDNTQPGVSSAMWTLQHTFNGKTVDLDADATQANGVVGGFLDSIPTSKTINIIANTTKNAQGTPYHQGGLATVNDQKGRTYRELISLPNGVSFIPQGRDVTMPLPKGTKILKASKTAQLIPKYANGTGIPADAKIFRDMRAVQQQLVVNTPVVDNTGLLSAILKAILDSGTNNDVIKALEALGKRPVYSIFDKKEAANALTKLISENQEKESLISTLIGGHNP